MNMRKMKLLQQNRTNFCLSFKKKLPAFFWLVTSCVDYKTSNHKLKNFPAFEAFSWFCQPEKNHIKVGQNKTKTCRYYFQIMGSCSSKHVDKTKPIQPNQHNNSSPPLVSSVTYPHLPTKLNLHDNNGSIIYTYRSMPKKTYQNIPRRTNIMPSSLTVQNHSVPTATATALRFATESKHTDDSDDDVVRTTVNNNIDNDDDKHHSPPTPRHCHHIRSGSHATNYQHHQHHSTDHDSSSDYHHRHHSSSSNDHRHSSSHDNGDSGSGGHCSSSSSDDNSSSSSSSSSD